jgi:sulfite dehydrogenase (quinone) subunit SoeC
MHPAYSVILFTTLSGAGYGLFVWLTALMLYRLHFEAADAAWYFHVGFAIALVLITAGLFASTSHLGRPKRAWRAFSQWRTSWLSREGVCAIVTYAAMVPTLILAGTLPGTDWLTSEQVLDTPGVELMVLGLVGLSVVAALATVFCTGMIYQSLPTIRAWHQPLVTPIYLAFALMSGGVVAIALQRLSGHTPTRSIWVVLLFLALAGFWKILYWRTIDRDPRTFTIGYATGLGDLGAVRPLDQPHTQANYIMREMGYAIARKHANRLRRFAFMFALLVPAILLAVSLSVSPTVATWCSVLAVVSMAFGLFAERWLFFAEAEHVVMLYYGRQSA